MTTEQIADLAPRKPLRLWPGVAAAVVLLCVRFILPAVAPKAEIFGMDASLIAILGGLAIALVIFAWWAFFSRAPWLERLAAFATIIAAVFVTRPFLHISIQNGMMGNMFYLYAVPSTAALALVAWAAASRHLSGGLRRAAMVAALLLGCAVWTLVRTDGIFAGAADIKWRWTASAEERLLARAEKDPAPPATAPEVRPDPVTAEATVSGDARTAVPPVAKPEVIPPATVEPSRAPRRDPAAKPAEWPGFRGPDRDSAVRGTRISTDWTSTPPVQLWRRPIGPGWSSFAVQGDLLYTHEQRGSEEVVS
jgi:hypothetical protein